MTARDEPPSGGDPGEPVESVTEEAVKLLGALAGWAREHGDALAGVVGHGIADTAENVGESAHGVGEHFATGGEDCTFCPICRGVHLLRSTSPEVKAHLGAAATSLVSALGALMAPPAHDPGREGAPVEHIDLDDEVADGEWPDDSGRPHESGDDS